MANIEEGVSTVPEEKPAASLAISDTFDRFGLREVRETCNFCSPIRALPISQMASTFLESTVGSRWRYVIAIVQFFVSPLH